MAVELVADELVEAAQKASGLQTFDSESYREGLDLLVDELNREAPGENFVDRNRRDIVTALTRRLKVHDYLSGRPELLKRPIERPIFVMGMPRTGTTLLSNLFATDPSLRSPLTWEIDDPIPPPKADALRTDPRALARLEMEKKMLAAHPEMGKYYRNSAIYPNECMFFMIHDFKGLLWEGRGELRRYRDWLFNEADLTSTYEYHKRFLQLLQADAPGTWNLKMPSHALWLDTLLKVYPDARLIWAHRDPYTATGSFCSLMSLSMRASTQKDRSAWISENYPWQAQEHADRIMDFRDRHGEDRIVDLHYAELMRAPIPTMRKLYDALGQPLSTEAEAAMKAWIDDNPQQKFGKHEYKLDQFGLSVDKLKPRFERYLARYDIEPEG